MDNYFGGNDRYPSETTLNLNPQENFSKKSKGLGEESLEPQSERTLENFSYLMAWIGGCVFIGYFMLGATLVPPVGQMNLVQAVVCICVSAIIVSICFNINGQAGHKYGIPFVVQMRSSFGFKGSKVPSVIRAIPAICWFGVQSWVGALALNGISVKLMGFDSPIFWFITFQFLQIFLASLGFKGIKWVENVGSIFILISLCYMLFVILVEHNATVQDNIVNIPGTWGLQFWGGTTAFLGVYTTLMLNISDYTREYKKSARNSIMFIIHLIATVPTTLFMALIGLLSAGVTGKWDPIYLFVEIMPNNFMLVLALLFIAIAQITTNVMLNVVPPAYVMMDMFNISYKKGAVVTGLLAFATFPWKLATADSFNVFIQFYSIFLGPIFAVMVVDYYLIRSKKLDFKALYDKTGPYKGINWAGIIAVVVGSAVGALQIEISWYLSLIPAAATYYLLLRYSPLKSGSFVPKAQNG